MNLYQLLKKYANDGEKILTTNKYRQLVSIFKLSETLSNMSSLVKATTHSKIVASNCIEIAKYESVNSTDTRRLEIAGLYHDILKFEKLSTKHDIDVYKYLKGLIPDDVLSIIYNHSDKFNDVGKTKLQKILMDADILSKYSTEYVEMNTNETSEILYKNILNTKKFNEKNLHFNSSKKLFKNYKLIFNLKIDELIKLRDEKCEYNPSNKFIFNVCYGVRNIHDNFGSERIEVGFSKILTYNAIRKNVYNININDFSINPDEIITKIHVNVFNITTGENILTKSIKIYNNQRVVV